MRFACYMQRKPSHDAVLRVCSPPRGQLQNTLQNEILHYLKREPLCKYLFIYKIRPWCNFSCNGGWSCDKILGSGILVLMFRKRGALDLASSG